MTIQEAIDLLQAQPDKSKEICISVRVWGHSQDVWVDLPKPEIQVSVQGKEFLIFDVSI